MGTALTTSPPPPLDPRSVARWRQDPRLAALLNALALDDGRTPRVPEDLAAVLPALVDDQRDRIAPLSDDAMEAELIAVMASLGTGIPQAEKTEWLASAMIQLGRFPAELCREALHEAVMTCESLRQVLKFVKDYCEEYPERDRRRLHLLEQLQMIAEGRPSL